MVDGDFDHFKSLQAQQRRQETVHSFKDGNLPQRNSSDSPKRAAGICNIILGYPVAKSVGNPGGNSPDPVILTVLANPAHRIRLFGRFEQRRYVGRIVLLIRIHGNNPCGANFVQQDLSDSALQQVMLFAHQTKSVYNFSKSQIT